jgi:hypothetical protein
MSFRLNQSNASAFFPRDGTSKIGDPCEGNDDDDDFVTTVVGGPM